MNRFALIMTVLILPAFVQPAEADGIFGLFSKKARVNPAQRVPELIVTLKTDPEERKRASAATELANYDSANFTEIVPVLVDVLQNDSKPAVRMDAASSLGSIRPVSRIAGEALERTQSHDDNWRVRMHAKGILMKYRLAGYSSSGTKGAPPQPGGLKTLEPPLLDGTVGAPPQTLSAEPPAPAQFPTTKAPAPTTFVAKTPPAALKKDDTPTFRSSVSRPLPQGPIFSTAVPQETSRPAPPALPLVEAEGPPLTPLPGPARTPTAAPPPPSPGPRVSVPPPPPPAPF